MATLKLYLDTRSAKQDGTYPLKIALTHRSRTAYYGIGVYLTQAQWDARGQRVIGTPQREQYNRHIANRLAAFDSELLKIIDSGEAHNLNVLELKNKIARILDGKDIERDTFNNAFAAKIDTLVSQRNKELYQQTLKTVNEFTGGKKLTFEDITPEWLTKYNAWRADNAPSQNARNIDLRNIRAVINYARRKQLTNYYPFLAYRIKHVETRKRSLAIDTVRDIFNWEVQPHQVRYLDYFKLIFFLIGINLVDLAKLKRKDYIDGRIRYQRSKGGRVYDIKVEPEAAAIIKKYRSKVKKEYLLDIMDTRDNYKSFSDIMNENLKRIGTWHIGKRGKVDVEPIRKELTVYWARHTWATIARNECNISRDDIRLSLGHGEKTVTDIYINEDLGRIDAANRKVIDCILGLGDFAPNNTQS